ncbi:la-related protein 6-like [Hydractinia symbiolongicarpus]|uniref:la-related protein 6-like n=1 Tax=Hydractinia symbiolongicarpus TaxID=13093 RepID=UPI00254A6DE5|nr:la-related protein 6-like [Hydractinia symbiolongicarpus]
MEAKLPEITVQSEKLPETNSSGNGSDSDASERITNRKLKLAPRLQRRDSGSSVGDDDEMHEVTDEVKQQIVTQAEYYFSDENLKKDGFLLKHVKRNKEGYVNLKLLASFKKMRSLCRDYRVIGEALKNSTKLVVNETGLKLRRVEPLPKELLDQARVKHLVVSKIPSESPSMTYITDAFTDHKDEVVSVRIVKPGKKFPNDLQSHFSRHPELRDEIVAVVEFDNPDIAAAALSTTFSDKYKGLCVKLLTLGPKQAKKVDSVDTASDTPIDSDASTGKKRNKKNKNGNRLLEVTGIEDSYSSYASSSDGEFSSFSSCSKRYNRSRGNSPVTSPLMNRRSDGNNNSKNTSPRVSPMSSPNASPKFQKKHNKKKHTDNSPVRNGHTLSPLVATHSPRSSPETQRRTLKSDNSVGQSAWMLKRMQMNGRKETENISMKAGANKHLDIIRQPKGPDGSSGFSNHPIKKFVLIHAC